MKCGLIIVSAFCFIGTLLNGIEAYRKGKSTRDWFAMATISFLMLLLVIFVEPKN